MRMNEEEVWQSWEVAYRVYCIVYISETKDIKLKMVVQIGYYFYPGDRVYTSRKQITGFPLSLFRSLHEISN